MKTKMLAAAALVLAGSWPAAAAAQAIAPVPAAAPAPAETAEATPVSATPPAEADAGDGSGRRVITLTIFGNDPCPKASPDEIVVCARRPETDRYRIPKALRHKKPIPAEGSWSNNAALLDQVSRNATMPGSCSPNGTNGQTGCQMQLNRQWYADRKARKAEAAAEAAAADGTGAPQ